MLELTNVEASQRVLAHLDEGRLIRHTWHSTTSGGRELACILGAMDKTIDHSAKCPASVMPNWLARLTVYLFDRQTKENAFVWARRFAGQMAKWHTITPMEWHKIDLAFRIRDMERALEVKAPDVKDLDVWPEIKICCEGTIAALKADSVSDRNFRTMRAAALSSEISVRASEAFHAKPWNDAQDLISAAYHASSMVSSDAGLDDKDEVTMAANFLCDLIDKAL